MSCTKSNWFGPPPDSGSPKRRTTAARTATNSAPAGSSLTTSRASATAAGDTTTKGPVGVCRLFTDQPARRRLLYNSAPSPSTSGLSPGPRGRHRALPRHSEASVWLGAGALALGLGAALTTGAGVAQADTGSGPNVSRTSDGPQTSLRTVVRATTIRSGAPAPKSPSSVVPACPLSATMTRATRPTAS